MCSSRRGLSVGSASSISFRYSFRMTEAPRFVAFSRTTDSVGCSMVISYKAAGIKASNKMKSINKQAAKNDCKGVSGSIIICPVLAVIRAGNKLRCSGVLTRYLFYRATS